MLLEWFEIKTTMVRKATSRDSGYSWIILATVFVALALASVTYINGIFNVIFLTQFGQSKALTSLCIALQPSIFNLSGKSKWLSIFVKLEAVLSIFERGVGLIFGVDIFSL